MPYEQQFIPSSMKFGPKFNNPQASPTPNLPDSPATPSGSTSGIDTTLTKDTANRQQIADIQAQFPKGMKPGDVVSSSTRFEAIPEGYKFDQRPSFVPGKDYVKPPETAKIYNLQSGAKGSLVVPGQEGKNDELYYSSRYGQNSVDKMVRGNNAYLAPTWQIDHIIPLALGGADDVYNKEVLNEQSEHTKKTNIQAAVSTLYANKIISKQEAINYCVNWRDLNADGLPNAGGMATIDPVSAETKLKEWRGQPEMRVKDYLNAFSHVGSSLPNTVLGVAAKGFLSGLSFGAFASAPSETPEKSWSEQDLGEKTGTVAKTVSSIAGNVAGSALATAGIEIALGAAGVGFAPAIFKGLDDTSKATRMAKMAGAVSKGAINVSRTDARSLLVSTIANVAYGQAATTIKNWDEDTLGSHLKRAVVDLSYGAISAYAAPTGGKALAKLPGVSRQIGEAATVTAGIFTLSKLEGYNNSESTINALTGGVLHAANGITDPIKVRDKADQSAVAWWQSLGLPTPENGIFDKDFMDKNVPYAIQQIQKNAPMAKMRVDASKGNVVTSEMRTPTAIKNDMENLQLVTSRLLDYGERVKANKPTFGDSVRSFFGLDPREKIVGQGVNEKDVLSLREILKYSREAKDTALYGVPPEILASTDAAYGLASNKSPDLYGTTVEPDLGPHSGAFQKAPVELNGTKAFAIEPVDFGVSARANKDARFFNNHYAGSRADAIDFSDFYGGDRNNIEAFPKAVLVNDGGAIEAWGYDRAGGSYFLGKIPTNGSENNLGGSDLVNYMTANGYKSMPVSVRSLGGTENPSHSLVITGNDFRVAQKFMPIVEAEFHDRLLARERSTAELMRYNYENDAKQQKIVSVSSQPEDLMATIDAETKTLQQEQKAKQDQADAQQAIKDQIAELNGADGKSEDTAVIEEPRDPNSIFRDAVNGTLDTTPTNEQFTSAAAKNAESRSISSGGVYNDHLVTEKVATPEEIQKAVDSVPEAKNIDPQEIDELVNNALKNGYDVKEAVTRRVQSINNAPFLDKALKSSSFTGKLSDEYSRLKGEMESLSKDEPGYDRKVKGYQQALESTVQKMRQVAADSVVVVKDETAALAKGKSYELGGDTSKSMTDYVLDEKMFKEARKELRKMERQNSKLNRQGKIDVELENQIAQQKAKVDKMEADSGMKPSTAITPFNDATLVPGDELTVVAIGGSTSTPHVNEPLPHEISYTKATGQSIDAQKAMDSMFGRQYDNKFTNFLAYDTDPTLNRWHNRIYDAASIDVERTNALSAEVKAKIADKWVNDQIEKPASSSSRFNGPSGNEPAVYGSDLASRMRTYAEHDMKGDSVPTSKVTKFKTGKNASTDVNGVLMPKATVSQIPAKDLKSTAIVHMGKVDAVNPTLRSKEFANTHMIIPGSTEGERGAIKLWDSAAKLDNSYRSISVTDKGGINTGEMENAYKRTLNGWNKSRKSEFKVDRPEKKNVTVPDILVIKQKSDNPESMSEAAKNAIRTAESKGVKVKYVINPTDSSQVLSQVKGINEPMIALFVDDTHNNGVGAKDATDWFGKVFMDKPRDGGYVKVGDNGLTVDITQPKNSVVSFHDATKPDDLMGAQYRVFSKTGDTGPLVRTASQLMDGKKVGVFVLDGSQDGTFGPQNLGQDGIMSVEQGGKYYTFIDASRAQENFNHFLQTGDQRSLGVSYGNKYDVIPRSFEAYMDMLTTRETVAGGLKLEEKALTPEMADSIADSYINSYNSLRKSNNAAGPNNPWRSANISSDPEEYGNYASGLLRYVDSAIKDVDFGSDLEKAQAVRQSMEEYLNMKKTDFPTQDDAIRIHNTALETVGKHYAEQIFNDFNEPIGKTIKLSKIKTKRFQMIDDEGNVQEIDNRGEIATPGDPMTEVDAMGNRKVDKLAALEETLGAIRPNEEDLAASRKSSELNKGSLVRENIMQAEPMLMSPRERRYLGLMDDQEFKAYGGKAKFGDEDPHKDFIDHAATGWANEAKNTLSEIVRAKLGLGTDRTALTAEQVQKNDPMIWNLIKDSYDQVISDVQDKMEQHGNALAQFNSRGSYDFDPNVVGRNPIHDAVLSAVANDALASPYVDSAIMMNTKGMMESDPSYAKQSIVEAIPTMYGEIIGKDLLGGETPIKVTKKPKTSLGQAVVKTVKQAQEVQSQASEKLAQTGKLSKQEIANAVEAINLQTEAKIKEPETKTKAAKYEFAKSTVLGTKVNAKALQKKIESSQIMKSPMGKYLYEGLVKFYGEGNPKIAEALDALPKYETYKTPIGSQELGIGDQTGQALKQDFQDKIANMVEGSEIGEIPSQPVWASTNRSKNQPKIVKLSSPELEKSYTPEQLTAIADAMLEGNSQKSVVKRLSRKAAKQSEQQTAKLEGNEMDVTTEERSKLNPLDIATLPLVTAPEPDWKSVASNVLDKHQDTPEEVLQLISEGKMNDESLKNWDGQMMTKLRKWLGDDGATQFEKDLARMAKGSSSEQAGQQMDQRARVAATNVLAEILKDEKGANTSEIGKVLAAIRSGSKVDQPLANVTDLRAAGVFGNPKAQARGVSYAIKDVKGAELVANDPLNGSDILSKDLVNEIKEVNERTPVKAVYESDKGYERSKPKAMVVGSNILSTNDFRAVAQAFREAKKFAPTFTKDQLVRKATEEMGTREVTNMKEALSAFKKLIGKDSSTEIPSRKETPTSSPEIGRRARLAQSTGDDKPSYPLTSTETEELKGLGVKVNDDNSKVSWERPKETWLDNEDANLGWKFHLATDNPVEVSKVLQGIKEVKGFKIGSGGDVFQDLTVYIGDGKNAKKAADSISSKAGNLLLKPKDIPAYKNTEFEVRPGIKARFEVPGRRYNSTLFTNLDKARMGEYLRYTMKDQELGVPSHSDVVFEKDPAKRSKLEKESRDYLVNTFGDYLTGIYN